MPCSQGCSELHTTTNFINIQRQFSCSLVSTSSSSSPLPPKIKGRPKARGCFGGCEEGVEAPSRKSQLCTTVRLKVVGEGGGLVRWVVSESSWGRQRLYKRPFAMSTIAGCSAACSWCGRCEREMSETKETKGGGARTGIGVTPLGCPIPLVQGRTALYFPTCFLSMQDGCLCQIAR